MSGQVVPVWEPYRPSNGTEGMMFIERWCERCAKERDCPILTATFVFDIADPEYPKEWIRAENDSEWPGTARCTAFASSADRARRAWKTRRENARKSCADLFAGREP